MEYPRRLAPARSSATLIVALAMGSCGGTDPTTEPSAPPDAPPRRIVSMAPALTEVLFALGAGDRVVGVTRFCDWPPEAGDRQKIGGYLDPDYETIVRLEPDLVVLMQDQSDVLRRLASLGLETLQVDQHDVAGVLSSIGTIARACGLAARGEDLAAEVRHTLDAVASRTASGARPNVLLVVEREVGRGSINSVWAAGPGTFYDDLVRLAGGHNVLSSALAEYPELSLEALIHLQPDVIVDVIPDLEARRIDVGAARADWTAMTQLAAVRQGRVRVLTDELMVIPGPRIGLAVEQLAAAIAGEPGSRE